MDTSFKPSGISVKLVAIVEAPNGSRFALAKKTDSDEHVTWGLGADGSCYWGHYGLSFAEGMADLAERSTK